MMIHEFQENLSIVSQGLRLDSGYAGDVNRTGDGWGDAGNSFVIDIRTGNGIGENGETVEHTYEEQLQHNFNIPQKRLRGDGVGCGIGVMIDGDGKGEGL